MIVSHDIMPMQEEPMRDDPASTTNSCKIEIFSMGILHGISILPLPDLLWSRYRDEVVD